MKLQRGLDFARLNQRVAYEIIPKSRIVLRSNRGTSRCISSHVLLILGFF